MQELVSSRLDGVWPPAAPRSNSVLGPIRHDMQEHYDLRQRLSRRELPLINYSFQIIRREIEGLILTKCHKQELHNLNKLEEFLIWT
jgi:hypothetical protein